MIKSDILKFSLQAMFYFFSFCDPLISFSYALLYLNFWTAMYVCFYSPETSRKLEDISFCNLLEGFN